MKCISRSGRERPVHSWDKDGVCLFCDHPRGDLADSALTPAAWARRKAEEADRRAMSGVRADVDAQRHDAMVAASLVHRPLEGRARW